MTYDAILIDTPPSSPHLIVAGMMAADAVVVPTLLDHLSFDGVGQFLRAYHGVIAKLKVGCAGALIVPSRVDLRFLMQKEVLGRMTSSFGHRHRQARRQYAGARGSTASGSANPHPVPGGSDRAASSVRMGPRASRSAGSTSSFTP
ncbi:ParA family protein [Labrys monachus]|uniref:Cellulose biosynthesis protein BcsQ n=1 Tax=Labrys monachus TaxID=217067 RepID=A0ABU0F7M3_9HYPH|nr:ParA family protein [Labrys monachus]MDQ0390362.1 cellulose biosynthesis protein BcsQ [Labrys monachus]